MHTCEQKTFHAWAVMRDGKIVFEDQENFQQYEIYPSEMEAELVAKNIGITPYIKRILITLL